MRIMTRTALIVALGVLAPTAAYAQTPAPPPPAPSAHPSPEVQKQVEDLSAKAFDAYGKGDFTTALTLYQQALQLAPAAAIYFNVANIYDKKLPDPHLAIDFYRKCVSASDTTPDLSIKATARIQALTQDLLAKQPAAPRADEAAGEDPGKAMKIAGGVILGLGALGLGLGIGFGVDANGKLQTARQTCTGSSCTSQAGVDAMNGANGSATVSTAMFVVGGVAAVTGVVLLAVAPSRKAAPATGLRFTPVVAPGHAGFALSGAFF